MFIASYICFGLGGVLIIVAIILFFKFDVLNAMRFVMHKRTGRPISSSTSKPRKQRNERFGKSESGRVIKHISPEEKIDANSEQPAGHSARKHFEVEESEESTSVFMEESEQPTGVLNEESEQSTGILAEDSEQPTGILNDSSEKPTGILAEDSEQPTGILGDDSEHPTEILHDEPEQPTGILNEQSETTTGLLKGRKVHKKPSSTKKKAKKPAAKSIVSEYNHSDDFYFDIIQNDIEIHTEEKIS